MNKNCYRYIICGLLLLPALLVAQLSRPTPSFGGRIIVGMLKSPHDLMHPLIQESAIEYDVVRLIFGNGLVDVHGDSEERTGLSDQFVLQPVDRTYRRWRMVLRRGVVFHNGAILRNSDVRFTVDLIKTYGGRNGNRRFDLDNILSVGGSGDLEVVFELKEADPDFRSRIAGIPILPGSYYRAARERGYQVFRELPPVGLGPFRLSALGENELRFANHANFYGGRAFLDEVRLRFYSDRQQLINALLEEEVDFVELPDRATAERLHDLMQSRVSVFQVPRKEVRVHFVVFNLQKELLRRKEVRRAIFLALNRRDMVKPFGMPVNTLLKNDNPFYDRSVFADGYSPPKALALLQSKGWTVEPEGGLSGPDGQRLSFRLIIEQNSELEESLARSMLVNLSELGIAVKPETVEPLYKEELLRRGNFEAMLFSYEYDPDYLYAAVETFYFEVLGAGLPQPNYTNKYLSSLFALRGNTAAKPEGLFQRFQLFTYQEMPAIFLFADEWRIFAINNRFQEYRRRSKQGDVYLNRLNPVELWYVPGEFRKGER